MTDVILHSLFRIYEWAKNYRITQWVGKWLNRLSNWFFKIKTRSGFINAAYDENDLRCNLEIIHDWENRTDKSIASVLWFLPAFSDPYAGITNILQFMRYMLSKGVEVRLVLLGGKIETSYCHYLIKRRNEFSWLKQLKIYQNPRIDSLPESDAAIATRCDTAFSLLKYNKTKGKFYFIQDDERQLYSKKEQKDLAEITYRLGFVGIASADCLREMYVNEFNGKAISYFTALSVKKPEGSAFKREIKRLFFYARPEPGNARNGFYIGMQGLQEIRKRHSDIEMVTAGTDTQFDDRGIGIRQLGKIPLEGLEDFYRSCDVGMYILLSRHSGVIPFELMATSVAVLTNKSLYTQANLKDGYNCLTFDLNPVSIADAFDRLCGDIDFCNMLIDNGFRYVAQLPSLNEEMTRVFDYMSGSSE
jgi:glycosyltransferase involved in cell wall biosynthesis